MSDYQMTVPMPIEQLQRRIGRAMVDASNLTSEHGDSIFAALNDALDVLVSAKPVRTSVPAETWEPVEDGWEYVEPDDPMVWTSTITVEGARVTIGHTEDGGDHDFDRSIELPDGYTVCRKVGA